MYADNSIETNYTNVYIDMCMYNLGLACFKQPAELFNARAGKRTTAYSIKHYIKLLKLVGRVSDNLL